MDSRTFRLLGRTDKWIMVGCTARNSMPISSAIRPLLWGLACCSSTACRSISIGPMSRSHSRNSGPGGTSRSQAGRAPTFQYRWAGIVLLAGDTLFRAVAARGGVVGSDHNHADFCAKSPALL